MSILAITTPGPMELVIIGAIFVLLFGAKKLPELGGAIGKSIKSFKQGIDEDGKDKDGKDKDGADKASSEHTTVTEASTPIAGDGK
jgi:sec-independent protein translocase protein TatA